MKIKSSFAILDVEAGRKELLKTLDKKPVPVTIHGILYGPWGHDDGISMELSVEVTRVITK